MNADIEQFMSSWGVDLDDIEAVVGTTDVFTLAQVCEVAWYNYSHMISATGALTRAMSVLGIAKR
jgi:hypothetical protein